MFSEQLNNGAWERARDAIYSATADDVRRALDARDGAAGDFLPLFSPAADEFLEKMAQRASRVRLQRFGRAMQLYAPLYISNECTNACLYCGFSAKNKITRVTLGMGDVLREGEALREAGFRHILLLTGEDRRAVPVERLAEAASMLHRRFASLSIEVYPMSAEEYALLGRSGVDGLTLYQETYHRGTYAEMHPAGKKRDYVWRLDAPDRGGIAGFRRLGIGALLGLADWRVDSFFTALHALYLSKTYWKSMVQVSFPRMRAAAGGFAPPVTVTDRDLTHLICAMRLLLPDAGLTLSTREPAALRDNLVPLGITMMSAGSRTDPGGYAGDAHAEGQFHVEDGRTPAQIAAMLAEKGFDPVWKDWDRDFIEAPLDT